MATHHPAVDRLREVMDRASGPEVISAVLELANRLDRIEQYPATEAAEVEAAAQDAARAAL